MDTSVELKKGELSLSHMTFCLLYCTLLYSCGQWGKQYLFLHGYSHCIGEQWLLIKKKKKF